MILNMRMVKAVVAKSPVSQVAAPSPLCQANVAHRSAVLQANLSQDHYVTEDCHATLILIDSLKADRGLLDILVWYLVW